MHQSELLTVAQAAELLGWSRWKVVRQLKAGGMLEGAGQKLGEAAWVVDRSKVEQLVAAEATL